MGDRAEAGGSRPGVRVGSRTGRIVQRGWSVGRSLFQRAGMVGAGGMVERAAADARAIWQGNEQILGCVYRRVELDQPASNRSCSWGMVSAGVQRRPAGGAGEKRSVDGVLSPGAGDAEC